MGLDDGAAGELEPSGFFALRTPLLPIEVWQAWTAADDPVAAVLTASVEPSVADALHLASPTLAAAVASADQDRVQRALPKLAAYLTRASARCTPFGLFAGCSVGRTAEVTRLELPDRSSYRRHTRLDNDFLFALVSTLEADPTIRPALRWSPNTSLYEAAGRWRYAEARLDGTLRTYHLVAVDDFDALRFLLARATGGATVDELARDLAGRVEVTDAEAAAFVDELIDAQLLVSDLALQVTGPEPLESLLAHLRTIPVAEPVATILDSAREALGKIDGGGPGATHDDYASVAELVAPLPVTPEPGRFLQVDMVKPTPEATLGSTVVDELAAAVQVLHRLAPRRADSELTRFVDAFLARYEDREVPLVEVLDEEAGIGFGIDSSEDHTTPLLAGLPFPPPPEEPGQWTDRDRWLLARCWQLEGDEALDLTAADVDALAEPDPLPLPDAVEVVASLAAASTEAVDAGAFRLVVHGIAGAPGVRLLGRFCHADEELHRRVSDHLRREEANQADAIFAEVVHLPEGRIGNILCRPALRRYEIPFLGRSGVPAERQIPVGDLVVAVERGRVVLRSARLGREVIPRLTTAHNFVSGTLGVYRFLCALQRQGRADGLSWTWGALAGAPFLPRVTHGRLVLSRARWTLRGEELAGLGRDRLPPIVALADGDNELVCDLANPLSREALRAQLRGRKEATFVEVLPGTDELCVTGPDGHFVHELVVPFVRTASTAPTIPVTERAAGRPRLHRAFPPGSEWLYAKLYTGTGTADRVLIDAVRPLIDTALAEHAADSWFFVRYGDPDWHLRVRLHGNAGRLLELVHDLSAPLLADGRIWRLELGTYQREVERYGGDAGMELSERVFRHDSDAVLGIVERLTGDEGLDARWRLTLAGTDRLLDDFGFALPEKVAWAKARRDAFAREFRVDTALTRELGQRYRRERADLDALLAAAGDGDHWLVPGLALLEERSRTLEPIAGELRRSGLPVGDLVASYAHMHANRLLRSGHRAQELVIHDLLYRLYQARSHRGAHG